MERDAALDLATRLPRFQFTGRYARVFDARRLDGALFRLPTLDVLSAQVGVLVGPNRLVLTLNALGSAKLDRNLVQGATESLVAIEAHCGRPELGQIASTDAHVDGALDQAAAFLTEMNRGSDQVAESPFDQMVNTVRDEGLKRDAEVQRRFDLDVSVGGQDHSPTGVT